ncbi:MAG: PAS domain S-box protein [Thermodesulfovibrionales bacterium]|nr:PAS domain S-box protein [Thermodesulfovibrionales bacterium]
MDLENSNNSELFYINLFNSTREPRIIIDPEGGKIFDANIHASRLFGLSLENLVDKNIFSVVNLNEKVFLLDFIKVLAGVKDFFIYEDKTPSGEIRTYEVYPTKCTFGKKRLLCLTFYDITSSLQDLRNLSFQKSSLNFILEETNDIVFLIDIKGNIIDVSKRCVELLGYSRKDDMVGKNLFNDLVKSDIKNFFPENDNLSNEKEITLFTNNGKKLNLLFKLYPFFSQEECYPFYILLSHVKEQKVNLKHELFKHKMMAIEQIVKGIAHEFNNILSGVIGFAELLKMNLAHDERLRSYIEKLLTTANRGAQLIKDLNTFSQRNRSVAVLLDINSLIREFERYIKEHVNSNIILELELSNENLTVMADPNQMKTVLLNLFSNADYAMNGQGFIKISTELVDIDERFQEIHGFGVSGRYVLISFTDSGGGIDESIIDKIFEPFFTTKEVGKGTGLGLSIVYGIIKQHNGFITVFSDRGTTTFRIYLPYLVSYKELINSNTKTKYAKKTKILVIEENEVINTLIKDILEGSGYKVFQAFNEDEALEVLKYVDDIDITIINSKFTIKDKLEKVINPSMKFIFLNGYGHDFLLSRIGDDKERRLLRKTFSAATLLKTVKDIIN